MIQILRGSVLEANADAIVNATDQTLSGGGALDRAIHKAAGNDLKEACKGLKLSAGESLITSSYNITSCKYIIHTVGPRYPKIVTEEKIKQCEKQLSSCYKSCLDIASEAGCKTIAFPCISTGVFCYPVDDAAKIALKTIKDWSDDNNSTEIRIYCYRKNEYNAYKKDAFLASFLYVI